MRCLDSENSDNLPGDEHREYLDRLRLGAGPGDTSEVFWTVKDSDNLPGDKQREIGKIGRLKLGAGPRDTSEVFAQ